MKTLTDRQKEVLEFIADFTEKNGYPPTVREIGDNFGISLRAVQDHIAACQKKGYLSQCHKRSRSIRVLKKECVADSQPFIATIPRLKSLSVQKPLLCEENLDGYVTVAEPFVCPEKTYFAVYVHGYSMMNAGILDGDLAIIELAGAASEGQIVAAVVDDAVTLKRLHREEGRICLQPENPDFQPVYASEEQIAGLMAGLIRAY